jgi:hypothetical protein
MLLTVRRINPLKMEVKDIYIGVSKTALIPIIEELVKKLNMGEEIRIEKERVL